MNRTKIAMIGLAALAGIAAPAMAQNVLVNPSFEDGGFNGWLPFGNAFIEAVAPRTGAVSSKFFGNFTGGENASGCFQEFDTAPGESWRASAWYYNLATDAMQDPNFAALNIEWRDAFGDLLGFESVTALTAASPFDVYLQSELCATAPADTARVRFVILFIQPELFNGGAAFVDDASFERASCSTCPVCAADYDQSGGVDGDDITAFFNDWQAGAPCGDVDGSGGVDGDDIPFFFDRWQAGGCN